MADKEIFQKVNEIDLEALIKKKKIYMSHDKLVTLVKRTKIYILLAKYGRCSDVRL